MCCSSCRCVCVHCSSLSPVYASTCCRQLVAIQYAEQQANLPPANFRMRANAYVGEGIITRLLEITSWYKPLPPTDIVEYFMRAYDDFHAILDVVEFLYKVLQFVHLVAYVLLGIIFVVMLMLIFG
ncbi:hypothetical protein F5Y08DRAFT_324015 [Xylaria arbuscula]|nr:hypothetical protein F5Y08DRAFT_324015 [Xylaria arbuscula]